MRFYCGNAIEGSIVALGRRDGEGKENNHQGGCQPSNPMEHGGILRGGSVTDPSKTMATATW